MEVVLTPTFKLFIYIYLHLLFFNIIFSYRRVFCYTYHVCIYVCVIVCSKYACVHFFYIRTEIVEELVSFLLLLRLC